MVLPFLIPMHLEMCCAIGGCGPEHIDLVQCRKAGHTLTERECGFVRLLSRASLAGLVYHLVLKLT